MTADIGSGTPGPGVRPAGSVDNPVTLYPTQARNQPRAKPNGKPIDWKTIKQGDTVSSGAAPAIAGKPFSVSCIIEGKSPSGIILAHGGSAIGYALYIAKGKITFAVRHTTTEIHRVTSLVPETDTIAIRANLSANGTLSLSVNESDPVSVESRGTLPHHPMEDFCLGHDDKNLLDDQGPSAAFDGKISSVRVDIEATPTSNSQ